VPHRTVAVCRPSQAQVAATAVDPTVVDAREMSGVTTRLTVGYVRERGGEQAVAALLARAGERRTMAELEDERGWSSYAQWLALLEAAVAVLGDHETARRIGASVVSQRVGGASRVVVRALGSVEAVYRHARGAAAKFSTMKTVEPLEVGRSHARIAVRLADGHPPHTLDCDFSAGVLTQVPALFGLAPATVDHEPCRARGGPACEFRLTWSPRRRLGRGDRRRRLAALEDDNALLSAQLESFQQTVADLVAPGDLGSLLHTLAARSAAAVHAQRVLLAIRVDEGADPMVHADGFPPSEAASTAADLLEDRIAEHPNRLVAEVASSRRGYGRILAENPPGLAYLPGERRLLEAHARLAAAALDAAVALEDANRGRLVATELLRLARSLADAASEAAVADRLGAATPVLAGADAGLVFRHDPAAGTMTTASVTGLPKPAVAALHDWQVRPSDTPELERFFAEPGVRVYDLASADPFVRDTLAGLGGTRAVVAPLIAGEQLLGVVVAMWLAGRPLPPLDPNLPERLHGLADHGATALQRTRLTDQVRHQALHDALTGLPNQALFTDRLDQALAAARRGRRHLAVAFLDLNRFKQVNDTLGHPAGDALLQQVADRLTATVRSSDTVARLGGDEFTVLFADLEREDLAAEAAARVRDAFAAAFQIDGQPLFVAPSIGLAVFPPDGDQPDELLSNADAAMYQAKRRGSLTAHRYTSELHVEAAEQLSLETDLHMAVTSGQLRVLYQPQVTLATGRFVGAEALVRWAHPARGLLSPDAFIPLAERTGLIVEVDLQVLAEACRQRRRWADQGLDLTVAVNVSGRTLDDPEAVAAIARVLDSSGTPPGAIEVELTESTSMQHDTDLPAILDRLKALGVRLAVDDFGTGYSMLSWLHQLPIDRLKIDRSFVGRLGPGADSAVVAAIVAMAHNLDLEVVAEGVETLAQADLLRSFGCAVAQGYLFGRPVEAAELARQAAGSTNQRSASKSADSPGSDPSPSPSPSGVRAASSRRACSR
jgi:diguanylate cyclase (GGDEF)-like protein